ncbi:MAG: phenylalanine--tRNA ligase subunit alpha [Candidatus Nitrosotenuis sp.]|uniref:phenylalanine--tRNA ligase n=1 Tax=Candidatus Nitrosotenuis uzonensis TaxID=1407055 RepID=A0A812EWR6_9ARCH|nr:phenylalanine--tRNA ligase subunit alpha [Candidatus Nitrosotenuis uzonensis]CAE6495045.1 putative Phenylalanyl-tRNA synthetase, alpha subunit [Candidatus Nitrosotenuis uzonensis]
MSHVLHPIEKTIIKLLKTVPSLTEQEIAEKSSLSADQTRRGIEWLKLKNLANVVESEELFVSLGKNGVVARQEGLPERKLVNLLIAKPVLLDELRKKLLDETNIAIANAKRNDWITITKSDVGSLVSLKKEPEQTNEERLILQIGEGRLPVEKISDATALESLKKRPDFVIIESVKSKIISLTEGAKSVDTDAADSGAIDVEADVPRIFAARTHPLKDTINEIREIFVSLGFSEIVGSFAQPSFWNFDALFTPQDHPAREMQDTFYIKDKLAEKFATPAQVKHVSDSHKKGWKYQWNIDAAKKMVLRTHTTCVTIRYLAENRPDEARVFSLGRVFRNEKVSYKHLVEFNQVEGIVIGNKVSLRDLMGIQTEFYRKMGLNKIKFWPTFFPYTEPSLQTMVYNDRLDKWVELFGMGIFRPEVTRPFGITKPVLAWGGGIERIAMLKYGLDDVREFYNNNLSWLRSVPKCQ